MHTHTTGICSPTWDTPQASKRLRGKEAVSSIWALRTGSDSRKERVKCLPLQVTVRIVRDSIYQWYRPWR